MEATKKGKIKKTFTVRCPKCNNVMFASATPTSFDTKEKNRLMKMVEQGCSTQTEDWEVGVGLPWCECN